MLRGIIATYVFELARARRPRNLIWFVLLFLAPVGMTFLVNHMAFEDPASAVYFYAFVVRIQIPLCLLLWATPIIQAELEAQTWAYISVRPHGRTAFLIGRWLSATTWSVVLGLASLLAMLAIAGPAEPVAIATTVIKGTVLASFAYGAIFVLIGVLFLHKAMSAAFVYYLVVEVFVTRVPAVVREVSIATHLRTLVATDIPAAQGHLWQPLSSVGSDTQYLWLVGAAIIPVVIANAVLSRRQLSLAGDG